MGAAWRKSPIAGKLFGGGARVMGSLSGSCLGKATYDDKAAALVVVERRRERHSVGVEGRGPLTPYRCRHCRGWHLGTEA